MTTLLCSACGEIRHNRAARQGARWDMMGCADCGEILAVTEESNFMTPVVYDYYGCVPLEPNDAD